MIEQLKKVFLIINNAERGSIDYVSVKEIDDTLIGSIIVDSPAIQQMQGSLIADQTGFKPLISHLTRPSYIHYCVRMKALFVCDDQEILFFRVIHSGVDEIEASQGKTLVQDVQCGGLETDKFGNLLYIDKSSEAILKIKYSDLKQFAHENVEPPVHPLYTSHTTVTADNLEDLTIEKEYLYWSNSSSDNRFGTVHKAFTEPFGRGIPLQTFERYDIGKAQSIATNSKYLFFTGYRSDSTDMELFVQNKRGAGYYERYS